MGRRFTWEKKESGKRGGLWTMGGRGQQGSSACVVAGETSLQRECSLRIEPSALKAALKGGGDQVKPRGRGQVPGSWVRLLV